MHEKSKLEEWLEQHQKEKKYKREKLKEASAEKLKKQRDKANEDSDKPK